MRFAYLGVLLLAASCDPWQRIPVPPYNLSRESPPATPGEAQRLHLGPETNHYMRALRYTLNGPGTLTAALRSVQPAHAVHLSVYSAATGNVPLAVDEGKRELKLELDGPGEYYVAVAEPYAEAAALEVDLEVNFEPRSRP
jgi:hypothetical protein